MQLTQCTDCDGGYYCGESNATAPTGFCDAGYYCQSGVDRPNPDNAATNSSYPPSCPLLGGHTGNSCWKTTELIEEISRNYVPLFRMVISFLVDLEVSINYLSLNSS